MAEPLAMTWTHCRLILATLCSVTWAQCLLYLGIMTSCI